MRYQDFKTQKELWRLLQNNQIISGKFLCDYDSLASYEIDCRNKIFKNCIIVKGHFSGTNFTECVFDNVVFRETEFITVFEDCEFIDCIFSNVYSGFTLENTKINCFSQYSEDESIMDYHIKQMQEKAVKNTSTNNE